MASTRRLITMRHGVLLAIGAVAVVAVAAGCNSGAAGPASQTHGPATTVTVVYSVGRPVHRRSQVDARCPAFAHCGPSRALGLWVLRVTRRLTCNPPADGYARPAVACAALRRYSRLQHRGHASVCRCPAQFGIPGRASGILDGHPVHLDLSTCAVCGLGRHASADLEILTPA